MAKCEPKDSGVDILKITAQSTVYTLEDGSTKTVGVELDPANGISFIIQTDTVITDADVAAKYVPLA